MVNVHVYVMVHNEEIILPYFLRHYGSFAERIIAFEDQSTDNSWEILDAHPLVTVIHPDVHGINEKYWTSTLWPTYEKLSRGVADYVMLVDADEFVYHPYGVISVLNREKERGTQLINCKGYTMVSDTLPTTQSQIYDEIRTGLPDRWSSKWIVIDPKIHIRYSDGLHRVLETDAILSNSRTGLRILHYRYFGDQYLECRDRKNRLRFDIVDGRTVPYLPERKHNLPDGTRGAKLQWYAEHKHKAVDVTI